MLSSIIGGDPGSLKSKWNLKHCSHMAVHTSLRIQHDINLAFNRENDSTDNTLIHQRLITETLTRGPTAGERRRMIE